VIRPNEAVFVDTGAWVALAVIGDVYHERAVAQWNTLTRGGARLVTSVPVVIETFTFLDRKGSRVLAIRWRDSLTAVRPLEVLGCAPSDLADAWKFFDRNDLHKLSLVDATSFALMRKRGIRVAFAFDTHFAVAGFRLVD
jgi:predicted nucleic acid-binding protein